VAEGAVAAAGAATELGTDDGVADELGPGAGGLAAAGCVVSVLGAPAAAVPGVAGVTSGAAP
jgi:hypothetical protein